MEDVKRTGVRPPKWMHFRRRDANDNILPHGGLTMCSQVDDDEETVSFAFSFCSKLDTFKKELGRTISLGRLKKDGLKLYHNPEKNLIEHIREYLLDENGWEGPELESINAHEAKMLLYYTGDNKSCK